MDWELLAHGYGVAEGPVVDPSGYVYFSDITKGGVYRIGHAGTPPEVVVPKRKGVGGLALHASGGVVVAGRDISHVEDDVSRQLVGPDDFAPRDGFTTSFNDFAVGPAGELYVGTIRSDRTGERVPGEFAQAKAPHQVRNVIDAVVGSNGAAVTADGRYLIAADSGRRAIIVASIREGEDAGRDTWIFSTAELPGVPDGLALQADGNIWVAFYGGGCLALWSPGGRLLERIDAPGDRVTSLCFDPTHEGDAIVTTADNTGRVDLEGCVFRVALGREGLPVPRVAL
jgi:xylono-1,5-lactonase